MNKPSIVAVLVAAATSVALAQPEKPMPKPGPAPVQPTPPEKPAPKPDPAPVKPAQPEKAPEKPKAPEQPTEDKGPKEDEKVAKMTLTSATIEHEKQMPKKYTVDGDPADASQKHISPPLKWSGFPKETQEFALIMDDPDARGFVHWVIYNIPASVTELPENLPSGSEHGTLTKPVTATQGTSSFRVVGYKGPAAGKGGGVHRYHFRIFALDKKLELKPGATKKELEEAMKGHILAKGVLIGNNER
jgi:Raf kinase inhibitor-like YbhB/YbcL family protein